MHVYITGHLMCKYVPFRLAGFAASAGPAGLQVCRLADLHYYLVPTKIPRFKAGKIEV